MNQEHFPVNKPPNTPANTATSTTASEALNKEKSRDTGKISLGLSSKERHGKYEAPAPHPATRPRPTQTSSRPPATAQAKTAQAKTTQAKTAQKPPATKEEEGNFITNYFAWRKNYLGSMTKGEKIRHRLLQFLVCISICVITAALALDHFVQLPDIPTAPTANAANALDPNATYDPETGELIFDGAEYPLVSQSGRKEGVYTFLIAGRDTASGGTDTMILVTYDTVNKTIDGMSLLRDTMVNINSSNPKLNYVYAYYRGKDAETQVQKGTDALKLQVSRLTGIVPDFYIMIKWAAVGELVDAIGGVEFEVPYDMKYDDPAQDLHIDQPAGLRLLDGEDAMEVIRHRKNNVGNSVGDTGRVEVQQDFLIAVAKTCLTPEMLLKAPSLAEIFFKNVETDLTVGNLLAFAQLAMGMDLDNGVNMVSMPYKFLNFWNGISYVGVSGSEMVTLVNESFNPYLDQIRSSDLNLMYSNSDGSFGVTNAALANSKMAYAYNNSSASSSSSSSSQSDDSTKETVGDEDLSDEEDQLSQPDPTLPDPNGNAGNSNTGDSSSNNSNTGDSSTGNSNTGDSSTGNSNTGDSSTGNSNNSNTGDSSTGNSNNSNTGDSSTDNSNNSNTGDSSTGNSNNSNTGDSSIPAIPTTPETPPATEGTVPGAVG